MSLIVQKYGGTSVGDTNRIRNVAQRIKTWRDQGHELVIVVSAMSGVTNNLIKMSYEVNAHPSEREMDMLLATGEQTSIALVALALESLDIPAVSLTGYQAGIQTSDAHTQARIKEISPNEVRKHLKEGKVVIVAGFQGQTATGQITTLGRGGSDLSAIALAAALKSDRCQIYTDVDGVYTADPRIVPNAKKIDVLSYDEMLEMSSLGAKVMQSRSVELAKKFGVEFEVRSSMNDHEGTLVTAESKSMEEVVIRGVSAEKDQAKVTIAGVPDHPGIAVQFFSKIAEAGVPIDMIIQNVSLPDAEGKVTTDISFTTHKNHFEKVKSAIDPVAKDLSVREVIAKEGVAKVSVVGVGIKSHTFVAAKMFQALSDANINIQMISTSEIKISVTIDESDAEKAVRVIHDRFELGN